MGHTPKRSFAWGVLFFVALSFSGEASPSPSPRDRDGESERAAVTCVLAGFMKEYRLFTEWMHRLLAAHAAAHEAGTRLSPPGILVLKVDPLVRTVCRIGPPFLQAMDTFPIQPFPRALEESITRVLLGYPFYWGTSFLYIPEEGYPPGYGPFPFPVCQPLLDRACEALGDFHQKVRDLVAKAQEANTAITTADEKVQDLLRACRTSERQARREALGSALQAASEVKDAIAHMKEALKQVKVKADVVPSPDFLETVVANKAPTSSDQALQWFEQQVEKEKQQEEEAAALLASLREAQDDLNSRREALENAREAFQRAEGACGQHPSWEMSKADVACQKATFEAAGVADKARVAFLEALTACHQAFSPAFEARQAYGTAYQTSLKAVMEERVLKTPTLSFEQPTIGMLSISPCLCIELTDPIEIAWRQLLHEKTHRGRIQNVLRTRAARLPSESDWVRVEQDVRRSLSKNPPPPSFEELLPSPSSPVSAPPPSLGKKVWEWVAYLTGSASSSASVRPSAAPEEFEMQQELENLVGNLYELGLGRTRAGAAPNAALEDNEGNIMD